MTIYVQRKILIKDGTRLFASLPWLHDLTYLVIQFYHDPFYSCLIIKVYSLCHHHHHHHTIHHHVDGRHLSSFWRTLWWAKWVTDHFARQRNGIRKEITRCELAFSVTYRRVCLDSRSKSVRFSQPWFVVVPTCDLVHNTMCPLCPSQPEHAKNYVNIIKV